MAEKPTLYCSFCGKSQHEVRKLIAGPTRAQARSSTTEWLLNWFTGSRPSSSWNRAT